MAMVFILALIAAGVALSAQFTSSDKVPRLSKEELKTLIGTDDVVIIDARIAREWDDSPTKIKGAIRLDPTNAEALMNKLPRDKTLIFYCD